MATRSVVQGLRGLSLAISGVMVASLERPCWAADRARSHPRVGRAADRAAALSPTAQIDALVSCLPRRAASAPPDFEPVMVDRMPRFRPWARSRAFDPFGGLVSAREGWPTSKISSPNQAFHDSIRAASVIMP